MLRHCVLIPLLLTQAFWHDKSLKCCSVHSCVNPVRKKTHFVWQMLCLRINSWCSLIVTANFPTINKNCCDKHHIKHLKVKTYLHFKHFLEFIQIWITKHSVVTLNKSMLISVRWHHNLKYHLYNEMSNSYKDTRVSGHLNDDVNQHLGLHLWMVHTLPLRYALLLSCLSQQFL